MKKKMVILGTAAITAAALPALAFENEFHGMYRVRAIVTNFQDSGLAGIYGVSATNPAGNDITKETALLSQQSRTYTLFEQRARLQYIAKASDDLKLVTHFEIDSTWGDAAYTNGRGMGGGIAADTVNLETKNVYLDFNSTFAPVNIKLGIQGWSDAYKGIFLNDDVGGAVATGKFGPATATAAFFRTYDSGTTGAGGLTDIGKKNVDVTVADLKYAVTKDLALGTSFYWANNDVSTARQRTYTYGLNAAAKVGIVDLDAFVLYQGGHELYKTYANPIVNANAFPYARDLEAFAAQVAAKANLGTVAVRAAALWASGDDQKNSKSAKSYQNIFASGAAGNAPGSSTSSGQYYAGNSLLIFRSTWNMDSDNNLVYSINNNGAGLVAGFLGADANINDKFTVNVNLIHAQVDERNQAVVNSATSRTTSKNIGTEANLQLNYKLYPNLTATLQGAYVLLGGYTKAGAATTPGAIVTERNYSTDIKDPYLGALMFNYTF